MKYDLSYCPAPNRREEGVKYPPPTISHGRLAVRYQMSKNLCQRIILISLTLNLITVDILFQRLDHYPASIYLLKVNNRNTKKGVKYVQSKQ